MKRFLLLLIVFGSIAFAQTGPGGITTNLQAWFDASVSTSITKDGSNNVSQWNDLSAIGNNAMQSNVSLKPKFNSNVINGFPAMSTTSSSYFSLPVDSIFITDYHTLTIIAAVKTASSAGWQSIFGAGAYGDYPEVGFNASTKQTVYLKDHQIFSTAALSLSTSYIVTYKAKYPDVSFRQNGSTNGTGTNATWPVDGSADAGKRFLMGDDSGEGLDGYLAEVAIYNRALNSAEINVIENHFGNKYGLTLTNDIYNSNDASYIYGIVGIGKESDGTASPAQNGGLVLTDVNSLANADYFLAGHNNATGLSTADLTGGDAVKRWTRIWFIAKTSALSTGDIKIAFDLSDAGFSGTPATVGNYRLLTRPGTTGDFSNVTLVSAAIVSTDQVEFTVAASSIVDGYYTLGTTDEGASPLPVELVSLNGSTMGNTVELKWNTATELNNYGFEVERGNRQLAISNSVWAKIGFVNGNGNSNAPKDYSFVDKTVSNGKYAYRLKQIDNDGKFEYSKEIEIEVSTPLDFSLEQNYPNPFNPNTVISWQSAVSSYVTLKVFNVLGVEVAVLVNEKKEPGTYSVDFSGSNLASGTYFYRLQAGAFVQTKKFILLK